MNRDYQYDDGHVENQLAAMERLGLLKVDWHGEATRDIRADGKRRGLVREELDKFVRSQTGEEKGQPKPEPSALLFKAPSAYPKLVNPYDEQADLNARAKSYLHANCAICHVQSGGGNARIELGFATPREGMRLFDTPPLHNTFGITDAKLAASGHPEQSILPLRMSIRNAAGQMPPLATYVPDTRAVELIKRWIAETKPGSVKTKEKTEDGQ
jgi:mono/diheme cytochrome c family protein